MVPAGGCITSPLLLKGVSIVDRDVVERIGCTVLGASELEGLQTFFEKVWESEYDYVAVLARRCFALHNIFMSYADGPNRQKAEKVISHNALLLYADKFAEYYAERRRFPTILLVDDLLIHGRGMGRILHHFENAICDRLSSIWNLELGYSERNLVHYYLGKAVQMRVYAINKSPLLVEGLYRHQIEAQTERYGNRLKYLSQQISSFIQEMNEPNTSYRYSVMLSPESMTECGKGWEKISWNYRGEDSNIYVSSKAMESFIPLVYTHGGNALNSNRSVWVTGLSIGGDLLYTDFEDMCSLLIKVFEKHNLDGIFDTAIKILLQKSIAVQTQRIQFISFLLSIVNVADFLSNIMAEQNEMQIQYTSLNLRHIATNFAREEEIVPGIHEIIQNANIRTEIEKILYKSFFSCTEKVFFSEESSLRLDIDVVNDAIDSTFQKIGMDAEKEAYDISTNKIRFRPEKFGADTVSLRDCMNEIRTRMKDSNGAGATDHQIVAALTAIVDSGLAALNFGYAVGEARVQCYLKAGELSTFSTPRKWNHFMPALAWVENERFDFAATPREMVDGFIYYLSNKYAADDFEEIDSSEKSVLNDFIQNGLNFADQLYYCEQSFSSWNMRLLTIGDWRAERAKDNCTSYYSFLCNHNSRCDYYLDLAKAFVRSKK